MKKIYSLLIVLLALASLQTKAQFVCTPGFGVQYLSGSTIKCNPILIDTPAVQHYWSFGDGSPNSATVSPTHTFVSNGTYTVCHYVIRRNPNNVTVCLDSTCMPVVVQQAVCNLTANYYKVNLATNPLSHQYFNASANFAAGDSIRWTFGDGTTSTDLNPIHNYANYGVYNVCLRVKKPQTSPNTVPCISEICRLDTVAALCNIQAYFTNTPDSATAPATIQFTNQSVGYTPTDSSTWNFGDGTPNSHLVNPNHLYASPGVYMVCLYVKKNSTLAGTPACRDTVCRMIIIAAPCNIVANYTYYLDSILTVPNSYHFTNTTTPLSSTDSIRWSFGDGTFSNQVNPNHIYTAAGTYNACLRVIKRTNGVLTNCVSEKCYPIVVAPINTCSLQVYFSNLADSIQTNSIHFTNQSIGYAAGDSLTWSFGDGTSSTAVNPVHTYTTAGTYIVCLTIKKMNTASGGTPCVRQYCKTIIVTIPCNLLAGFTYYKDSSATPVVYHFTNTTTPLATSDSIRWTFGDGSSSNQVNPTHTYTSAGTYNVCLRVIKRNNGALTNCISEKCFLIVVQPTVTPCTLISNFTWYRDSIPTVALHTVYFANTSFPLASTDSIRWTFGDGTSSNQVNPVHVYQQPGSYTVCLRIIKRINGVLSNCISEKCNVVLVSPTVTPCNLQAYFSSMVDSVNTNLIYFTNQSIGYATGDSITWSFGDGTFSNSLNPNHTYTSPGAYVVCLTIKKNNNAAGSVPCIREFCKTIVVTVPTPCTLVTNFTWYRDSLPNTAITTVHFTNTSTPLSATDSIRWTFGDGTTSSQANPVHVYAQSGSYNVCLRIIKRNTAGLTNCVSEKCYTIIVPQLCNIVANFIKQVDVSNSKRINFTNITVAPTGATALWDFGDGTTSTMWSPSRIYTIAGTYYVCLRIQYGTCISYKCDTINVVDPPFVVSCINLSKLSASTYGNNQATFAVFYPQNNVQYTWTFGDGTGAQTGLYASHTYATVGTYNACLTAYRDSSCASTTCKNIYITPNCNNITLSIGDVRDSLVPNRIKFTALSNTATTSQQWTITKIPTTATGGTVTINGNNPTYMFLDSGYYNVCVKATYANGCVKTICKTIRITQNMPGTNVCTLQAYPNPASSIVNAIVTLVQPQLINATIYSTTNAVVAQAQQQGVVGLNTISMNIASLPAGIYTIRVMYGTQICSATFMKQ
jgi:PKD repeat protein